LSTSRKKMKSFLLR